MAPSITLPTTHGTRRLYTLGLPGHFVRPVSPPRQRIAFAAAHVVVDPLAEQAPGASPQLDWEATLAYRRHLWSLGFAVAEAMDTAQRGGGLDWPVAQDLIRRALVEARACKGIIACGAGTDQLALRPGLSLRDIEEAYEEQIAFVEAHGGRVILMASTVLAAVARTSEDYLQVYGHLLQQVRQPVIIHWLGPMFAPALAGYWGSHNLDQAMDTCLRLISDYHAKIDGIKLSLLDADREIAMRRRLPPGVRMYTGDDFNYAHLIDGDDYGYSDALLGIFDPIAPAAAAALAALDAGDRDRFHHLLAPTLPLSRHIFQFPTYAYKTGVVFLAYLNGHQNHFRMVGGQESARSILHLSELFMLADQAGLLVDPERAVTRFRPLLNLAGVECP